MRDPASEFRGITLPRTRVNRRKRRVGAPCDDQRGVHGPAEEDGEAGGDAVGEALGETVVAGTVRSKVVVRSVPSGGTSVPVRSVRDGGSGGPVGAAIQSSRSTGSNVERVMAATAAPTSTTGARTAVRGNSTQGESPAWVRPRTR